MVRVLDERASHLLLLTDDGSTELVPKTDRNKLLWQYGLFGLLREQSESLVIEGDDEAVFVAPTGEHEDGAFRIVSSEFEYMVPENRVEELVEMLVAAYEETPGEAPRPAPIVERLTALLATEVDPADVDPLASLPPFADAVEVRDDGWYIHEHVLLTYDNEFFNLDTESKERSGGEAVPVGSKQEAYELQFAGETFNRVSRFLTRAVWAVDHTEPPA